MIDFVKIMFINLMNFCNGVDGFVYYDDYDIFYLKFWFILFYVVFFLLWIVICYCMLVVIILYGYENYRKYLFLCMFKS